MLTLYFQFINNLKYGTLQNQNLKESKVWWHLPLYENWTVQECIVRTILVWLIWFCKGVEHIFFHAWKMIKIDLYNQNIKIFDIPKFAVWISSSLNHFPKRMKKQLIPHLKALIFSSKSTAFNKTNAVHLRFRLFPISI